MWCLEILETCTVECMIIPSITRATPKSAKRILPSESTRILPAFISLI